VREFPREYDHCFLGNGTDGVLVGYSGAMVPERVNTPEQSIWYKSDRYYPPERPIRPVPHRHYRKEVTRLPDPSDSWYELAPLGRSWYAVLGEDGRPAEVVASRQQYDPRTAVLSSTVRFGNGVGVEVTTFLHPTLPLLVVQCQLDTEATIRVCLGGGPWTASVAEPSPLTSLTTEAGEVARLRYALGDLAGEQLLWLDAPPDRWGQADGLVEWGGPTVWLERRGESLTFCHAIVDQRDPVTAEQVLAHAREVGAAGLADEHARVWSGYRARSTIMVPDGGLQRLYDAGLTLFRSIQSPISGGIPVGIMRYTWSSHLFWDAYFPARALLEANHADAARAECGFLLRTADRAREHARATFGVAGLAWDWELTHDGRRAYGRDWAHLADQVHNTAAYSNLLFDTWRYTRDEDFLAEVWPLLDGIAEFMRGAAVEERPDGWGTRPLVGVHESDLRVRDDAFNLAGVIRALENAEAGRPSPPQPPSPHTQRGDVGMKGSEVGGAPASPPPHVPQDPPLRGIPASSERGGSQALRAALDGLYDGRLFRPYADATAPTLSSLAPIWPMEIVEPNDPRARSTASAFRAEPVFLVGGGWPHRPWEAAILARIFADQRRGAAALDILTRTRPAMNMHGGVCEILDPGGGWNLQYFSTGHGALCSAIHGLLLGRHGGAIRPFPSMVPGWRDARFERLLLDGLEVSASLEDGRVRQVTVTNTTTELRTDRVFVGRRVHEVTLRPGESRRADES
jgi:hypothetical protein